MSTQDTFISHLIELRDRLLRAIVAVLVLFVILFFWPGSGAIYDFLAQPLMRALPEGSPELAGEAHRLRGAAGLYGLARVSVLAGEVEAAARAGREPTSLLERLVAAVAATREALRDAARLPS